MKTQSQIIFAHLAADGIAVDNVIDIPHVVPKDKIIQLPDANPEDAPKFSRRRKEQPIWKTGTAEDIAEVERDVVDMDREAFSRAISHFTVEALAAMVRNAGLPKVWERVRNQGIRKMRLIMALKMAYFPDDYPPKKVLPPHPWRGIPTNDLVQKANERGITWATDRNWGINRMRLIMALKKAGIQPSDITNPSGTPSTESTGANFLEMSPES